MANLRFPNILQIIFELPTFFFSLPMAYGNFLIFFALAGTPELTTFNFFFFIFMAIPAAYGSS